MTAVEQSLVTGGWARGNGNNWYPAAANMKDVAKPLRVEVREHIEVGVYWFGTSDFIRVMIFEDFADFNRYVQENGVVYPALPAFFNAPD